MKFAFERRFEAMHNREKIIENICDEVIAAAECKLDKAVESGLMGCVLELPHFQSEFVNEVKKTLNGFFEMWGYRITWIGNNLIHITYEGD